MGWDGLVELWGDGSGGSVVVRISHTHFLFIARVVWCGCTTANLALGMGLIAPTCILSLFLLRAGRIAVEG